MASNTPAACMPTSSTSSTIVNLIDDKRSVTSTRSGRFRRRMELRRIEEEKSLCEVRNKKAAEDQKKLDDEYLQKKYSIIEQEIESETSVDDEFDDPLDEEIVEAADSHLVTSFGQRNSGDAPLANSSIREHIFPNVIISGAEQKTNSLSTNTTTFPTSNLICPVLTNRAARTFEPTSVYDVAAWTASTSAGGPMQNIGAPQNKCQPTTAVHTSCNHQVSSKSAPIIWPQSVPINVTSVYETQPQVVQIQTLFNRPHQQIEQTQPLLFSQENNNRFQQGIHPNYAYGHQPRATNVQPVIVPQPQYYQEPIMFPQPQYIPATMMNQNQIAARQSISRDLPTFSGRPEEWPIFVSNFERSTQVCGLSNDENMIRLQRSLKGNALEAVRSRLLLPNMVPEVIETLRLLYGRPELILHSLLTKIRDEPSPKADRLDMLINYALVVQNLNSTIIASGMVAHQNNPMLLKELVDKLPTQTKLNWAMFQQSLPMVDLDVFSNWLFQVARAASSITTMLPAERHQDSRKGSTTTKGIVHTHTESSESTEEKMSKIQELEQRWKYVKENKLCGRCFGKHRFFRCKSNSICGKNGCTRKHHKLLHNDNNDKPVSEPCNTHKLNSTSILFRIVPVVLKGRKKSIETYAFLDDGSSVTLIDENLANELELDGTHENLCLQWTSNVTRVEKNSRRVSLMIASVAESDRQYKMHNVRTVKDLHLPTQSFTQEQKQCYEHLRDLPAETYSSNASPKIMIGLDHWRLGAPRELREGLDSEPLAARTVLGWTIHGKCSSTITKDQPVHYSYHVCACETNQDIHKLVKAFFSLDNFGVTKPARPPESIEVKRAREMLEAHTVWKNNRYETCLLWKYDKFSLPDSFNMAFRRLVCLEKKMMADPRIDAALKKQMVEYVEKSYARKLSDEELALEQPHVWYLPVFVVTNPNKPAKVRMVWDAAAKVNNVALNSMLLKGPDLLTSLQSVLFGFRLRRVALCGDIKEMFHQVRIRESDQHSQRFLWRNGDMNRKPDHYVMQVMTFGASCSPSAAQFVKNANANKFIETNPRAVHCITEQHYVDDLLDSVDTEEEAIRLAKEVYAIHQNAGYEIRNWLSNSPVVLAALDPSSATDKNFENALEHVPERVLGLWWSTKSDSFTFVVKYKKVSEEILMGQRRPTKREVLRTVMSIYDPLGFLSSFLVFVKILLQRIWRAAIDWDEPIGDKHFEDWLRWIQILPSVSEIRIPRCYCAQSPLDKQSIQLHVFVDASENAFAAVAYFRITFNDQTQCSIVAAKTKVAPLVPMSIPRLELQAAILGARLATTIKRKHHLRIDNQHFWTDSRTVLCWLRASPREYHQFVAYRLGELHETTDIQEWHWVPTAENVADEATKWQKEPDISSSSRWFNGPSFLKLQTSDWPKETMRATAERETEELRSLMVHQIIETPYTVNINYFDNWWRIMRAQAFVFRVAKIWAKRENSLKYSSPLTKEDYQRAEIRLIQRAQFEGFPNEVRICRSNYEKPTESNGDFIDRNSKIYSYSPYMDNDGILRCNGRIDAARAISLDVKRPIILPRNHHITNLLVDSYHKRFHHQNHETVVNEIRQRFVIPRLRQVLKSVRTRCQQCKTLRAAPNPPKMADLPIGRLAANTRPFSYIGIDYFGPMNVTVGRRTEKRWGVLITCLTIRAVHIEIAHSLTTDACILSIRNFVARRGTPSVIYCDNGTNFHGAKNELDRSLAEIDWNRMRTHFESTQTEWKFNPPAAPHMGGSWERLVGSVKRGLRAVLPNGNLSDEVLRTFLMEIENVINSRPLTHVSLETSDAEAITPNHLLIGTSNGIMAPGEFNDSDLNVRKSWRASQQLANQFWKRWIREYLPTLTRRTKWFQDVKSIEVGDVVVVVDEKEPRNSWPKGRVLEVITGKDGKVRSARIQTKNIILVRPAVKIAVIDVKGSL